MAIAPESPEGYEHPIDVTGPVVVGILADVRRGFWEWAVEHHPEDQTPDSDINQMALAKSGREIAAIAKDAALLREIGAAGEPKTTKQEIKRKLQALSPQAIDTLIETAASALKAKTDNVLDAVSAADREWFAKNPKRRLYMRPVLPDELAVMSHAVGVDVRNHDIMLVGSLSESVRLRVPLRTPPGVDINKVSEGTMLAILEGWPGDYKTNKRFAQLMRERLLVAVPFEARCANPKLEGEKMLNDPQKETPAPVEEAGAKDQSSTSINIENFVEKSRGNAPLYKDLFANQPKPSIRDEGGRFMSDWGPYATAVSLAHAAHGLRVHARTRAR